MKYVFRSNLLALAFALVTAPCVLAAPGSAAGNASQSDGAPSNANVFSVPEDDNANKPRFASTDGRPAHNPQEQVPGWQEIRMIPSLSGERRKLVQELFNKGKTDSASLKDEMKQIRTQIQQQAEANAAAATAANGQSNDSAGQAKQTALNTPTNSGGQASAQPRAAVKGKATPEQKARMAQIRTQLQEIRAKTWDEVKAMLTAEDQRQLELMRDGKLLPDNLQKADRRSAAQVTAPKGNAEPGDNQMADDNKTMQEN